MRWATLVLIATVWCGCSDLRDFRGIWAGPRVGEAAEVRVGVGDTAAATLAVDDLDLHGLRGQLSISGLVSAAAFQSLPGAEADALAGMTFAGSPLRVYLGFVAIPDGAGEALAMIALYDDKRIEVRVLRGGIRPLYAIFALTETAP